MAAKPASRDTITRLFMSYRKQGIPKVEAIRLIAAALGLGQAVVLDIVDQLAPVAVDDT